MLGGAIMLWILWMALRPDPGIALDFPYGDKLLHATTFTGLVGWWGNVYRERRARGWAALGCLAFGVFIEFALLLLRTSLAHVLASVESRSMRWRRN